MTRWLELWRSWRSFCLLVATLLIFRSTVADWNQIPSGSMKPNLLDGDRIVVDKLAYDLRIPFTRISLHTWADPQRGDVVTFQSPRDERLLVKRVLGVPGDEIELRNNRLFVNSEAASYERLTEIGAKMLGDARDDDQYLRERVAGTSHVVMWSPDQQTRRPGYGTFGPVTVPAHQYVMLGDNRDNSADFRMIGFVDRSRVLGRSRRIAFSIDYDNHWLPRPHRWFIPLP